VQNDLEFGEDGVFVQCIVSYGLMLMAVPVKGNFEELITSCKIDRFGTPPNYAGEISKRNNHRSFWICV